MLWLFCANKKPYIACTICVFYPKLMRCKNLPCNTEIADFVGVDGVNHFVLIVRNSESFLDTIVNICPPCFQCVEQYGCRLPPLQICFGELFPCQRVAIITRITRITRCDICQSYICRLCSYYRCFCRIKTWSYKINGKSIS